MEKSYYKHEKITETTTAITNIGDVRAYLVEGKAGAYLIDSGVGIGDLKAYVESITAKPILGVLLTHGHLDHAGGLKGFKRVYLNEKDWVLAGNIKREARLNYAKMILGPAYSPEAEADALDGYEGDFRPLKDGMAFSLGGVRLIAIALPGHTEGEMCFLCPEERWVLTGDGCNTRTFLFLDESTSISEYREELIRFKEKYGGLFDRCILSHGPVSVPPVLIDESIALCDEILAREDDAVPFSFMDRTGIFVAKEVKGHERADGGLANIVYSKDKLFE